ncbi:MAG: TolC family protein [Bacteroidetes bacterium]|nr:TolC family protein [Bacteroidota bacterium]MBS1629508.1 TolC family protein [Bacteroidota bacterium]
MPFHGNGYSYRLRFNFGIFLSLILLSGTWLPCQAQTQLSEAEFVKAVLANPVNMRAPELALRQQQQLLKSAPGIDRLRLSMATDPYDPTEIALEQDIAFPSVYVRRYALQRAQVHYAQAALNLNKYDLIRKAKELYVQWQWLIGRSEVMRVQDSLFEKMALSASRSFDAGQVNALEKQFAANRYGHAHNSFLLAAEQADAFGKQASILAALQTPILPVSGSETFLPESAPIDTSHLQNPVLALQEQAVQRNRSEASLQRAEAWPGFSAGIGFGLGDEVKQRPFGIRAGLTLPIYFWQSSARIAAAQTGVREAEARQQEGLQEWKLQTAAAESASHRAQESLRYFEAKALPRATEIINTAFRLFAAGQISYSDFLRNVSEAFDNRIAWQQARYDYQLATINLQYLKGIL